MRAAVDENLEPHLASALDSLELSVADGFEILQARSSIRAVVRVGGAAIKVFANSQRDDWNREVAAYDALAATGNDLAPELLGFGPLWVATEWLDLVTAESADAADDALNIALGHSLAALHVTPTRNMPSRSMPKRLEGWLAGGSETCPAALLAKVREVIEPLASLCLETSFTHGDWGSANVLVRSDSPGQTRKSSTSKTHIEATRKTSSGNS